MGKRRGPPRLPSKIVQLRGNPGKRRRNRSEPKPKAGAGTCPTWLSTEAKREWRRIVPELERLGLATTLDRALLAVYCDAWAQFQRTTKVLQQEGSTFTTKGGFVRQRPEVAIQRAAVDTIRQLAAEFGLSPSARSRIEVDPPPNGGLERFFD